MQRLLIRCFCTGRQSYYDILGLSKTATAAEIKKAFYTLSKKYHPDLTGGNKVATKKFLAVKQAYDTLKDTDKQKEYDNKMIWSNFSSSSHGNPNPSNPYKTKSKKYVFSWEKFFDLLPFFAIIIIALIRIAMRISRNLDEIFKNLNF